MRSEFLLHETILREPGMGPELNLGERGDGRLSVTLHITRTAEQQSLDLGIWGSPDGVEWDPGPLLKLPRQFYCGTCRVVLDLSSHRDIRWLRAHWQVARWGREDFPPHFGVELLIEPMQPAAAAA